ncbi:MAG: tetratricopeptide repeat protein [Burkholderiales bacterium]
MKALEKAAQDRDKAPDKPPVAVATRPPAATALGSGSGSNTLSLEPIEPTLEPTIPAKPADTAPRDAARHTATPGAAGTSPAAARSTGRSGEQARASVLLSAQQPARATAGGNAAAWISTHPVPFTAALAGLFALGYGGYIYLQAAHPSLFLRTPAPQPQIVATPKPAPVAPAPRAPETTAADPRLIPAQSAFSSSPDSVSPPSPSHSPATAPPAIASANAERAAPAKPAASPPSSQATAAAFATPVLAPAQRSRVAVSSGDSAAPRVNPVISDAYAALESGKFDDARRLYDQALRSEPNNIDALLGLAAIAQQENRTDDASKHYLKILDIDPRHALAQTGLIALLGRADPQAAETRLKQLAARDPSPALYFTLGNLYADQGQWSQAQQSYFQAHHLDAGNPDYAYNLAVALEHLSQQKLALGFYRRAVQLAAGRGRANFNPSQAQTRISQLAARLE